MGVFKALVEMLIAVLGTAQRITGAWKSRKLKTETDTETDGGNGNTQAIVQCLNQLLASSVASCTDTYVFNLTLMAML